MEFLPAIDILDSRAVRLAKGDYSKITVYNENPLDQAKIFEEAGASIIHVVDLDGARDGSPKNIDVIESIATKTSLKIEVGGGIRNIETLRRLSNAGVSRMILGTSLVANEEFSYLAIAEFGRALVAGIDAKAGEVAVHGWEVGSGISADILVAKMAEMGYKHLVYTDIAKDGMQTGIDCDMYLRMAQVFKNPVIASGGLATIEDVHALARIASSIEGIIAGRAIYENAIDVREALDVCKAASC